MKGLLIANPLTVEGKFRFDDPRGQVVAQGSGLLVANPLLASGKFRFDDPRGQVVAQGSGLLVANPLLASGKFRFDDPRGTLPPVIPVAAPTITGIEVLSSSALRITFTDNQVNPSAAFTIYCWETGTGTPAPGYPKQITIGPTHDITGLSDDTNYAVNMVAHEGTEASPLSNTVNATTDEGGTPPTSGWQTLINEDFESYALGAGLSAIPGFGNGSDTTVSDVQALSGTKSLRCYIDQNSANNGSGFGDWGWINGLSSSDEILDGQALKVTTSVYFPNNFDFRANPHWLKFIRFRRLAEDGSHRGFNDILFDYTSNDLIVGTEGLVNDSGSILTRVPHTPVRGSWNTYSFEVHAGRESVDSGGTGRIIVSYNDTVIADLTNHRTFGSASNKMTAVYVWTHWNNGTPQPNECWHDNFLVEKNEVP